jgi:Ca-activated chloride channel family protein
MKPLNRKLVQRFLTNSFIAFVVISSNICLPQRALSKFDQSSSQSPITDEIKLTVTVTNSGLGFVDGLTQQSFTVFDNKSPQQINSFRAEDVPISVGILFDMSDSARGRTVSIKKSLSTFIEASNKVNEYFLVGFSDRPELQLNWTRDGDTILNKLADLQGKGNTALYDACRFGMEKIKQGTYPKRAMILITDGNDNVSHFSFRELREMLRGSDVMVYAIGIYSDNSQSAKIEGQAVLDELSRVTGGMAFYPTTDQAKGVFEHIAMELRHQYSIGFIPVASSKDRKWHPIKVKVTLPLGAPQELKNLIVRNREGYYNDARTH